MTSEIESTQYFQHKSDNSRYSPDRNTSTHELNSSFSTDNALTTTRLETGIPSLQSTVKVDTRKDNSIDRFKTCPLLLRVFYTYGRHHNPMDYKNKQFPKNEIQIHTWMDATLSEIIINLQQKNRKVRRSGTIIKFQLISPDPARPRYKTRDIGVVKIDYKGPDDYKTLSQCRYSIGDFVDLCIKLPKN